MIVRPFRVNDLDTYRERAVEIAARPWLSTPGLEALEADPLARTIEIDGQPVCSGGFTDLGNGIALAWAVLTEIDRSTVLAVHRAYHERLAIAPFGMIGTHVAFDFDRAHRWVRLLGFEMDAERPTELAGGKVHVRYIYRGKRLDDIRP